MITDIQLPTRSDLQLLVEIKKVAPMVDVIVVTDFGGIETYLEAIRLGAAEYISRPFRMKNLKLIMHGFIRNKSKSRS